ncbi:hypothetical protein [Williamsia sp. D3]|uniref:hypothetical protein n=1 Tax=Williamsia sp. D3 TaxID=1313067 RepID=UPI0003D2D23F|nr:hypothetical protein [Williamsia sp. D3]ETD34421.1 hypothetical protein W823_01465 [Williamsia sp. D3]
MTDDLETPPAANSIYSAKGAEVEKFRPTFTGDIYDCGEEFAMLVQHPCALHRGAELCDSLLAVVVRRAGNKARSRWREHAISEMPLPELFPDGYWVGDFSELRILKASDLVSYKRVAVLSQIGVNLLMQRWVYHCSRVVVPTALYDEQTFGPFNEAELSLEWVTDYVDAGKSLPDAVHEFHRWIRASDAEGEPSRQSRLADRQAASAVRKEMRRQVRTDTGPAA